MHAPRPQSIGKELLVADSFRVRVHAGVPEVRGYSLHAARFRDAVLRIVAGDPAAELTRTHVDEFLADAATQIQRAREGFPRLECRRGPDDSLSLACQTRPLPPLRDTIEMEPAPGVTLGSPSVKGPNIERLGALAAELGAEPLLLTPEGSLLEGATTSLLWWRGSEARVVTSAARVPSVTERLVTTVLRDLGYVVTPETTTLPGIAGCEVWALNALHGIRPVTRIGSKITAEPDHDRLARVRAAYDDTWEPVSSPAEASA